MAETKWVISRSGVPIVSDFETTRGQGTPIVIDESSDTPYYLKGNTPTPFAGGGGSGRISVTDFGAVGDGVTDDGPAFVAAIDYCNSLATAGYGYSEGAPSLFVPAGIYNLYSQPLDLNYTIIIEGETSAGYGGMASVIKWSAGTSGFRVQRYNTSGDSTVGVTGFPGGDGSIIRQLGLVGGFTSTEAEKHAIHAKARCTVIDVYAINWEGDALHSDSSVGDGTTANLIQAIRLSTQNCRCSTFMKGGDNNAGYFESISGILNRQANVWDRSFLGNSYQMPHGAAIARTSYNDGVTIPVTFCHFGGNHYFSIIGQEAWASANSPTGTTASNQGWFFHSAGGADPSSGVPTWFAGITVRGGGHVVVEGLANSTTVTAPYGEIDSCAMYDQRCLVLNPQGDAISVSNGSSGNIRSIIANSNGIDINSQLHVQYDLHARAVSNFIGPMFGATAVDGVTYFTSRSTGHAFSFKVYDSSGAETADIGGIVFGSGFGASYDITHGGHFQRFRLGGTTFLNIDAGGIQVNGDATVNDQAYGSGWNGSLAVPTRNAIYDKINAGLTGAELAANSGGGTTAFLRADGSWASGVSAANGYLGTQTFTSGSGTYTPSVGTSSVIVEIIGGGGAGGGSAVSTAGNSSPCAGGGAGGYVRKRLTANFSGASYSVGTGGTGVAAATGNSGGNSTFTDTAAVVYTAGGGTGGASSLNGGGASPSGSPGQGGTATNGDLNIPGSAGYYGVRSTGATSFAGNGGNSVLGTGGRGKASYNSNTSQTGSDGGNYGAGGGGALSSGGGTSAAGGAGGSGLILVHEYS